MYGKYYILTSLNYIAAPISPAMWWRKIERGINPPPQRSVLKKFCVLAATLSYEQAQLFALARQWKPHIDTNSGHHNLLDENSSPEWIDAMTQENTPDYEHKYWGRRKG